jgi:hypothetical protein
MNTTFKHTMKSLQAVVMLTVCLVGLCLAATRPAHAQEVTNLRRRQSLALEAGLESAVVARVTYMHRLDASWLGKDSRLYARFALPVAAPDFADFAFDAGLRTRLFGDDWGMQLVLGGVIRNTTNPLFNATALGVRALILPGYQSDSWGLMAELGVEQILATQVLHSSLYKRTFYAGAKDGWYAITGGTLRAGLRGGLRLDRVEVSLSAGVASDEHLQLQIPPFYATFGTAYVF